MTKPAIYTIGYGNRKMQEFIQLLHEYNITLLVDVRTIQASRFQPAFNRDMLQLLLAQAGIAYIYSGDSLGGRPDNDDVRTNGHTDYDKIRNSTVYQQGLQRLLSIAATQTTCIMCSELNPDHCHRKRLIGESLYEMGVQVLHIDEQGSCRAHAAKSALF